MDKKKTAGLATFIQQQESGLAEEVDDDVRQLFDQAMEDIAVSRFRLCLLIFVCLLPLLSLVDYSTRGFPDVQFSTAIRIVMELVLFVYSGLTMIPQFKRNTYVFTFLLAVIMGIYNLLILLFEGEAAMENYIVYALIFSIIGVVMPWGGKAIAGICFPVYLLYPIGIALVRHLPVTGNFFLKSNIYLISFFSIVIFGAYINERFRFQEFLLKHRMQAANRMLEDYQTRLKRSYQRMESVAIIDHLTGVYNRTYLTHWLNSEIHKNKMGSEVFSIIMYDLDQFKEINDAAGHQMGDLILQRMTEIVQENLDGHSPIFRYGGDEFCIILPGLDLPRAVRLAEMIRKNVENNPELLVKFSPTESFHLTISMGVISEFVTGTIDSNYLIRWVDAALLESKRAGRNCIHVFDPDDRKIKSAAYWLQSPSA